jgi:hypothetical protein
MRAEPHPNRIANNGELIKADTALSVAQKPGNLGIEWIPLTPRVHHDEVVAVSMHLYEPESHVPTSFDNALLET